MEITEIRVFLKESQDKKLKAYTTVTFDNVFVVRNIKVIQGSNGLFIAMPSRKLKGPCAKCHFNNEAGAKFCNQCGAPLADHDQADARAEHRDIAHPVTQEFREYLQKKVLEAYQAEASQPKPISSEVGLKNRYE